MASGSGWNLWVWLAGGGCGCGWNIWVWLVGVVVRRDINFLILLIPIYSSCICSFFAAVFLKEDWRESIREGWNLMKF